jgi:hypothetical protein
MQYNQLAISNTFRLSGRTCPLAKRGRRPPSDKWRLSGCYRCCHDQSSDATSSIVLTGKNCIVSSRRRAAEWRCRSPPLSYAHGWTAVRARAAAAAPITAPIPSPQLADLSPGRVRCRLSAAPPRSTRSRQHGLLDPSPVQGPGFSRKRSDSVTAAAAAKARVGGRAKRAVDSRRRRRRARRTTWTRWWTMKSRQVATSSARLAPSTRVDTGIDGCEREHRAASVATTDGKCIWIWG